MEAQKSKNKQIKNNKKAEPIKRPMFKRKQLEIKMERTKEEKIYAYRTFERKIIQIIVYQAKSLT